MPVTGVALLLRALILGDYAIGLPVLPAGAGADVGLRRPWRCAGPIDQFQREDVLFREAERFNLADLAAAPDPRPGADADRRPGRASASR